MSFDPYEFDRSIVPEGQAETIGQYTAKTFLWMVLGLMVTFGVAVIGWMTDITWYAYRDIPYLSLILLIATLAISITMVSRIERMAVGTAVGLFILFSALFGFTLSVYLYVYQLFSIVLIFLATAVYFGVLAAYGYLTKRDLSGLRPILISGLIFLIIVEAIMLFVPGLTMLDQVMCFAGIALFLGYTAYDTQKIRAYYQYYAGYPDMLAKASIFSALQLYLDFLNLFIRLLQILGSRKR